MRVMTRFKLPASIAHDEAGGPTKEPLVRGSLRIRIHHGRKQTPAGVLGRQQSGGTGKRPALVSVRPITRPVCIKLLTLS